MVLAEELRRAVLQAALQGKLTEQLDTDSGVDDLLECIQTDKEKRIKNGGIKIDKRLAKTMIDEEEIPFPVPVNWRWTTLGSIVYKLTDGTHRTPKYTADGVKFISVKNMSSGVLDLSETKYISQAEHDELYKRCNPEKGDMLLSKIGTTGVPAIVDTDEKFSLFVSVALLKYSHQFVNESFLYYLLWSPLVQEQAKENTRGVGNKNWVLDFIAKTMIPFPPIEEQQRIADKINRIMPKIDEYEKIEKELQFLKKKFPTDMKNALLQAAMQGKLTKQTESDGSVDELLAAIKKEKEGLTAQKKIKKEKSLPDIEEEEIPFDIPENWRWVRLRNIVYNGGQKTPDKCFSYIDIGSIDNVHQKLNNEDNILEAGKAPSRARKIVKYGDVLYATVRPYLHNMCIIDRNFQEEPIASTGFAVMTCCKGILNRFLLFYMLSPEFDRYANSKENAKGMAYPAINDDKFYRALIPLPPLKEQQRIVERLDSLLPLCEELGEE